MPFTLQQSRAFWAALQVLTKARYEALIKVFGSLASAAAHTDKELLLTLGCRADTIQRVLRDMDRLDAESESMLLDKENVRIIAIDDDDYPALLRETADAPPLLFVRGDIGVCMQPCVAMVGTRRMSEYGKRVTDLFTTAFARAGIVTVSGLARGVDTDVAMRSVDAGGKTVAVLGQGIATLSSRAMDIAKLIVQKGGCVVSEFPLRFPPDVFTFPRRNRIIAGLSSATVVLEAPESSGALITARSALDENREVFAVPGPIFDSNYDGCHALLSSQQAQAAFRPDDVLRSLHILPPAEGAAPPTYLPHGDDDRAIWNALTTMPQHADMIVEKSHLPPGTVGAVLTSMEVMGVARNLGMNMWVRV